MLLFKVILAVLEKQNNTNAAVLDQQQVLSNILL